MGHELDQTRGGILITDVEGRILYANQAVTSSTGFLLTEIRGKKPSELWGGNMSRKFYKNLWDTIKAKKRAFFAKVKNTNRSGGIVLKNLFIAPIVNELGNVEYFLEIEPIRLDRRDEFIRNFESVIQNQHKHPDALMQFIQDTVDFPDEIKIPVTDFSPAIFLETLVARFADIHLDEDVRLIALSKEDPQHFQKLYSKYQPKIFNYFLYRTGGDVSITEELTQDVFTSAFNALPHFTYKEIRYLTYLLSIAHNRLINYYQKMKPILVDDVALLPLHTDSVATEGAELKLLWDAVHHLLPLEKTILTMKYSKDLPIKQIAKKLNKSENAVKLHLSRARKKLKSYFETPDHMPMGS